MRSRLREALLAGATLDQIAARLDAHADMGEEQRAALWLYAWAEQRRLGGGGPPERSGEPAEHVTRRRADAPDAATGHLTPLR